MDSIDELLEAVDKIKNFIENEGVAEVLYEQTGKLLDEVSMETQAIESDTLRKLSEFEKGFYQGRLAALGLIKQRFNELYYSRQGRDHG